MGATALVGNTEDEGGNRFASVSTYQGPPDQIDDGLRYAQENIVPSLQVVEGFEGVYLLVDRQSGKVLTITLWESERRCLPARRRQRSCVASIEGSGIKSLPLRPAAKKLRAWRGMRSPSHRSEASLGSRFQ